MIEPESGKQLYLIDAGFWPWGIAPRFGDRVLVTHNQSVQEFNWVSGEKVEKGGKCGSDWVATDPHGFDVHRDADEGVALFSPEGKLVTQLHGPSSNCSGFCIDESGGAVAMSSQNETNSTLLYLFRAPGAVTKSANKV
jgi:sugar lactone lactonase YvrE